MRIEVVGVVAVVSIALTCACAPEPASEPDAGLETVTQELTRDRYLIERGAVRDGAARKLWYASSASNTGGIGYASSP